MRFFLGAELMNDDASRRGFLQAAASAGSLTVGAPGPPAEKVRYAELRPHEFRKRLAAHPIAWLPLGTLEWHGEHLPLGSDAIQSEGLMIECARRFGGIVMPPIHLGPDRARPADNGQMLYGMDYAASTTPARQLDGSCYWVPLGLHVQIVDAILEQLKRAGFRAVFADGHGPSRTSWAQSLEERQTRFGLKLFGVTKDLAGKWRSQVDHAGRNETSLMMHLRGDLVDLSQLPEDRSVKPVGVGGQDPRLGTAEFGRECLEASVEIVGKMLQEAGLLG
ncbi:MAG: creatininase family protein [Bryobacteraceae bacterium]